MKKLIFTIALLLAPVQAIAGGYFVGNQVPLQVVNGGTNCIAATITCFNNITGFSAAGTTGTTSTNLVFSASPTITGTLVVPITNGNAIITDNFNATAVASLPAFTSNLTSNVTYRSVCADSSACAILGDSYGSPGQISFERANGTAASPTGLVATNVIGRFGWYGYQSNGVYSPNLAADIFAVATETWSGTANGNRIDFAVTQPGTVGAVTGMSLIGAASPILCVSCTTAPGGTQPFQVSGNIFTNGSVTFTGVTTGTNADTACFAAGGVMTLQAAACTISDPDLKSDKQIFTGNLLASIMAIKTWTFRFKDWKTNPDPNTGHVQLGIMAPDVAKLFPLCTEFYADGHKLLSKPKSWKQDCMIAVLFNGFQNRVREEDAQIKALKARIDSMDRVMHKRAG